MSGKRVVVKVGSSTLASAQGGLDPARVCGLVAQIETVRGLGHEVVLVSSGAIAAGVNVLGLASRPSDMPSLQAAASVGQVALIETYAGEFSRRGSVVGQVLLTRHDTGHRESFLHARDTFQRLLELGAVPIVNENDTVAVDEIRFGDNDTLAALVATMVSADLVVLMSDIEGVFDADPRKHEGAVLMPTIDELTDEIVAAAGGSGSEVGSGGMVTKLEAARVLMRAGIEMVVCDGSRENVLVDAVCSGETGTSFRPGENALKARKLWIALGRKASGGIVIDAGAVAALATHHKSLLPAGVVDVEGEFEQGDAVVLRNMAGAVIGRGLTDMSSAELRRVRGMRTADVSAAFPDLAGRVVVHTDRLAIL